MSVVILFRVYGNFIAHQLEGTSFEVAKFP